MSSIREKLTGIFSRSKKQGKSQASYTGDLRSGGYPLWLVSTTPSLCVSTAYRCIDLLSKSVANLPIRYKKRKGTIFLEDQADSLTYLLNIEPDKSMNAFDFWRQVVIEVLCTGNAYIVPYYSSAKGGWYRLALCGRGSVSHNLETDTYTVNDYTNGIYGVFDESRMIHIKGMPGYQPKTGVSVLTYARITMNTAAAGDQESLKRIANGGTVKGILAVKEAGVQTGNVFLDNNEEAAYKASKSFERQLADRDIVTLPGEYDFKQFSMSSADMQFLESRKFTVREICRFFGVHPSFVFDDTSNNYKSAEMANVAFLSNTLNPLLRQIENELLRKLVSPGLCLKRKFEFDRQALYSSDLESRVKYMSSMIAAGIYTVNEVRALEDRPPVEGGDKVLVSANLKNIDELTGEGTPAPKENEDGKEGEQ